MLSTCWAHAEHMLMHEDSIGVHRSWIWAYLSIILQISGWLDRLGCAKGPWTSRRYKTCSTPISSHSIFIICVYIYIFIFMLVVCKYIYIYIHIVYIIRYIHIIYRYTYYIYILYLYIHIIDWINISCIICNYVGILSCQNYIYGHRFDTALEGWIRERRERYTWQMGGRY